MIDDRPDGSADHLPELEFRSRLFWAGFSIVVCGLFALPLILMLYLGGDYLPIANESLAYRYFAGLRVQGGEGGRIWLPQGYVTSLLQHLVLWGIEQPPGRPLSWRLNAFSVASNAINVVLFTLAMCVAAQSRRLGWRDKLLLAMVALLPIYATRTAGFYYSLLPDYYHLDMVLAFMGVALFLWQVRGTPSGSPWFVLVMIGGFVGICAANKVTLVALGPMLLLPALLREPYSWRLLAARISVAFASALVTFIGVIWAFYLFEVGAVGKMLVGWLAFIREPGGESDFWTSQLGLSLWQYSLAYVIGYWALSSGMAIWSEWRAEDRSSGRRALVLVGIACGLASIGLVFKRPAGTTLYELSVILTALSVMLLAATIRRPVVRGFVGLSLVAWLVYCAATTTFSLGHNVALIEESPGRAKALWGLYEAVQRMADGRPIVVIFPDNSYHHEGIHELLLKGASDFPTWHISKRGQWIIDRFAPGMTYRHESSGTPPNAPIPSGVLVLWFDRPDLAPLTERYRSLRDAIGRPGVEMREWVIWRWTMYRIVPGGRVVHVFARAALLP
jgi:hypothetical protein